MAKREEIDHPKHYTAHPSGVECIIVTEHMNFNIGNAIKYLWRAGLKEGVALESDLLKARWYVERELARVGTVATASGADGADERRKVARSRRAEQRAEMVRISKERGSIDLEEACQHCSFSRREHFGLDELCAATSIPGAGDDRFRGCGD